MMRISGITDIGMQRENNQDTFEYGPLEGGAQYAIVCDGMGGENGGDIASKLATGTIVSRLKEGYRPEMEPNSIRNLLLTAISAANVEIYNKSKSDQALAGMGTTVVAVILRDGIAYISHVGDSRAYIYHEGKTEQITTDHSIVQELIAQGKLSESDADDYPHKNLLTRAVGVYRSVTVDYLEETLLKGDKLLLCTDGLTNFCPLEMINRILEDDDIESSCKKLVNAACNAGGFDNITAIIITD